MQGVIDISWLEFASSEPSYNEEIRSSGGDRLEAMLCDYGALNEELALSIPAVQACVNLICGTVAQGPIYLYKKDERGTIERIEDDERVILLNEEPNDFMDGYTFKYNLTKDILLHGRGSAFIEGNLHNLLGLHYIEHNNIYMQKYKKNGIISKVDVYVSDSFYNKPRRMHDFIFAFSDSKDGITGKGILEKGRKTLLLAAAEQQYSQSVYENGALPLGVLKTDKRLSDDAMTNLKNSWKDLYQGLKNSNKTIILEEGLDYKPMSLKPSDLQLDTSRNYVLSEICRLFNVPESLINAGANKYGSIEQNNIHFLQYCISPIFEAIEKGLNKSLLLEDEKAEGYFFAVDETVILRTTLAEKMTALKTGLDAGLLSINEARGEIHRQKLDKDLMRFSLGNVFYDKDTTDMIIPNMGGIININNKEFLKLGDENVQEAKNDSAKTPLVDKNEDKQPVEADKKQSK